MFSYINSNITGIMSVRKNVLDQLVQRVPQTDKIGSSICKIQYV